LRLATNFSIESKLVGLLQLQYFVPWGVYWHLILDNLNQIRLLFSRILLLFGSGRGDGSNCASVSVVGLGQAEGTSALSLDSKGSAGGK
jgi:hypothetical protein